MPWLALPENLKLLGDAIGIELEFEATESRVGIFKADIVAKEAGMDDRVIVLSPAELSQFRAWFLAYDEQLWDQQLAAGRKAGKLDKLMAEARADFQAGKARAL